MSAQYNPQLIEGKVLEQWQQAKLGVPSGQGESYCIMLPPPNVTGSLHMGHGFQLTLMDVLIRQQRMLGKDVLWQPGTDHAGIATQMVVERQLAQTGVSKYDLGRDAFVAKVWDWKHKSGGKIESQIARMGASVDWDRKKFTLDADLSKAVQQVFIKLYQDGLIYKGSRLTNWDCKLQTAVSDLEVCHTTKQGEIWYIKYLVTDSDTALTVATTRPETLFGDVAVAVNPQDARYQALIGKEVIIPIANRVIPIIADDSVDMEFGTGCVKITPAHDFNDNLMGLKHKLPMHNILNLDGTLNDFVPISYQGLDRFVARDKLLVELAECSLLVKTEPYEITLPIGDRSGSVLEPLLTEQWFMRMEQLAANAIAKVKQAEIKFVPANWESTYFQWLENIQDWCISRQLWWGHRIPAWYDAKGRVYVGENEAWVRQEYQLPATTVLTQDEDVLDTWFSSALWPFATLGWPEDTIDLAKYFPTQVLVTGFDIIFFWVARMIMLALHFTDKVPFETVYITGLIRDYKGHKMSKSKGNVIDPIDLIEGISLDDLIAKRTFGLMQPEMKQQIVKATQQEYPEGIVAAGTDAVRFTFCALASTGRDIRFDSQRLFGYRNFCNKLWNACRYLQLLVDDCQEVEFIKHEINLWILTKLNSLIQNCEQHLAAYRFDLLAKALYEFTWEVYCDWYVEFSKVLLTSEDKQLTTETKYVLALVMSKLLRLLHPIIPFITHALWQDNKNLQFEHGDSIAVAPWPKAVSLDNAIESVDKVNLLQQIISAIRAIRSELGISPAVAIKISLVTTVVSIKDQVKALSACLIKLAKLEQIEWLDQADTADSAVAVVGDLTILVGLKGLIDVELELARIAKSLTKLEKQLQPLQQRLANEKYIANAPQAIIAKAKLEADALEQQQSKLQAKLLQLQQMQGVDSE